MSLPHFKNISENITKKDIFCLILAYAGLSPEYNSPIVPPPKPATDDLDSNQSEAEEVGDLDTNQSESQEVGDLDTNQSESQEVGEPKGNHSKHEHPEQSDLMENDAEFSQSECNKMEQSSHIENVSECRESDCVKLEQNGPITEETNFNDSEKSKITENLSDSENSATDNIKFEHVTQNILQSSPVTSDSQEKQESTSEIPNISFTLDEYDIIEMNDNSISGIDLDSDQSGAVKVGHTEKIQTLKRHKSNPSEDSGFDQNLFESPAEHLMGSLQLDEGPDVSGIECDSDAGNRAIFTGNETVEKVKNIRKSSQNETDISECGTLNGLTEEKLEERGAISEETGFKSPTKDVKIDVLIDKIKEGADQLEAKRVTEEKPTIGRRAMATLDLLKSKLKRSDIHRSPSVPTFIHKPMESQSNFNLIR